MYHENSISFFEVTMLSSIFKEKPPVVEVGVKNTDRSKVSKS